ncbi:MAG: glycosyltransferase family 4 protein [Chloroflexi bacterium]|nr:glycosyltransferase family 4 protein [Chloroflexota bacterium]
MSAAPRHLRIAQVAPPLERVPPIAYGGTERVVFGLTTELVRRGHDVTVFASGDSDVPATLAPTVPKALRPAGFGGDPSPQFLETIEAILDRAGEFDVIHSHLEWWSVALARLLPVPVVSTFHGRLDVPWSRRLFASRPRGLVAISRSQASVHPDLDWTIIHNGLDLESMPTAMRRGDSFCFVGRVEAAKGILEAIEIAQFTGRPLRIAAKIGTLPVQVEYFESVVKPAIAAAGSAVEFLGELGGEERDRLFAESYATLMPGAWPEPFGLVAIESLACGTPVLARRVGALPEIIREGVDGLFGDDAMHLAFLSEAVADLDRAAIRERVVERFSAARMTDRYEELYIREIESRRTIDAPLGGPVRVDGDEPGTATAGPDGANRSTGPAVSLPPRRPSPTAPASGPVTGATIVDGRGRSGGPRPADGPLTPVGPGRNPA